MGLGRVRSSDWPVSVRSGQGIWFTASTYCLFRALKSIALDSCIYYNLFCTLSLILFHTVYCTMYCPCAHFMYTMFKSLRTYAFDVFKRSLFCSPRLHLFDEKYSGNCEILLQLKISVFYVNIVKCNLLLWCKAEFSASLLQSSVSHDLQKSF